MRLNLGGVLAVAAAAFLGGVLMTNYRVWPLPQIKEALHPDPTFGRLVSYPGKKRIACPAQTARTRVLLVGGQSNAANKGGQRFASRHPGQVINYFDGQCFEAASPLLGAQGSGGEYWTMVGDQLVEQGADRVILIPTAIFATSVRKWAPGGKLHPILLDAVKSASAAHLTITDIVWDQGEEDHMSGTGGEEYADRFRALVQSLRDHGVGAPVYVATATRCGLSNWAPSNPVADAQRALPDERLKIRRGPDMDAFRQTADRYDDCHLSAVGQVKSAAAWTQTLTGASAFALHQANAIISGTRQ